MGEEKQSHIVTTPLAKAEGLLARAEPPKGGTAEHTRLRQFREGSVRAYGRFNLGRRLVGSKILRHRLAHQTICTLVLLPEGTIYLGTRKHY